MIIYAAVNEINGKTYIGQTRRKFFKRKSQHKDRLKDGNTGKFYNALRKYGWDNFTWWVLETCDSLEELNAREAAWIVDLDTLNTGYNATSGGDSCYMSEEACLKVSLGQMGRVQSEATRQKIREKALGRKPTAATIAKCVIKRKKSVIISSVDEEKTYTFASINEAAEFLSTSSSSLRFALSGKRATYRNWRIQYAPGQTGRKVSDEARKKMSAANQGRTISPESALKIAERHRKPVMLQHVEYGTPIFFESVKAAAAFLGKPASCLTTVLTGKTAKYKDWYARYA